MGEGWVECHGRGWAFPTINLIWLPLFRAEYRTNNQPSTSSINSKCQSTQLSRRQSPTHLQLLSFWSTTPPLPWLRSRKACLVTASFGHYTIKTTTMAFLMLVRSSGVELRVGMPKAARVSLKRYDRYTLLSLILCWRRWTLQALEYDEIKQMGDKAALFK